MHPACSRLIDFSAAVIAAVAAVLAVVLPSPASAQTASAAGTRVGASHPQTIFTVGPSHHVSAGEGRDNTCPQAGFASGLCVAAEDTGSLAGRLAATCGGASFTPSTKVLLASGAAVPISQLKAGDKVLATNTKTGKTSTETVAAVLVHHDTNRYDLSVKTSHGSAVIATTTTHLFWDTTSHRWIKAAALKTGDHLRTSDGTVVAVTGGQVPAVAVGWMWDLTVPGGGDHDFYIQAANTGVLVHNCSIPRGFADQSAFEDFGANLKNGLAQAGYDDSEAAFQGSSVTGVKFTTGAPFDVGRVSDYDIALSGSDLFSAAQDAGIPLRAGGIRTGPLSPGDLEQLGLSDLRDQLSASAGRPVNFMIYQSLGDALGRSPSIVVP